MDKKYALFSGGMQLSDPTDYETAIKDAEFAFGETGIPHEVKEVK
jgi:hypothetical protein